MQYFFHLFGTCDDHDEDGANLPDLASARREAIIYLADLMSDDPHCVSAGQDFSVQVTNGEQRVLFTITAFAANTPVTLADP